MSSCFSLDETEMERAARDAGRGIGRRWASAGGPSDPQETFAVIAELGFADPQSAAGEPELAKLSILAFEELGAADLARAAEVARHLASDRPSPPGQGPARGCPAAPASGSARHHAVQIICAVLVGAMRSAVDQAFVYASERRAFGKPILNHQAVALRLADMLIAAESATLLLHAVASGGGAATRSDVMLLAAHIDASSQLIFRDAVQVAAAHGYVASSPTARWFEAAGPIVALLREVVELLHDDPALRSSSLEPSHAY